MVLWLPLAGQTLWQGRGYCADNEPVEAIAEDWNYEIEDEEYGFYEYDKHEMEWQDYEFDHQAAYYEAEDADPVNDFEFDVAEYDSCYASYIDARKRFNDLRMARGFLPVVTLDPSASASSQAPSTPNPKGKGKKGKSKGKGKNIFRPPRPPMKAADPRGRAQSTMVLPHLAFDVALALTGLLNVLKVPSLFPRLHQAVEGMALTDNPLGA